MEHILQRVLETVLCYLWNIEVEMGDLLVRLLSVRYFTKLEESGEINCFKTDVLKTELSGEGLFCLG